MRRALTSLSVWAFLSGASALAQESTAANPPLVKDREAVTFNEIERGFNFAVAAGPNFFFNPPSDNNVKPSSAGELVQLELGADLGPNVAVSLFVQASHQAEPSNYEGQSGGAAVGDFTLLVPGVSFRVKPFGIPDAQSVERTWFYVRAGAGYATFSPTKLLPNSDILVFAGPGIEYYTRLRHFSIGVEAVGSLLLKSKSFGLAVTPNLRYAF